MPRAPQADMRTAVPVDMAPGTVTAVPAIASGAEAIRVAREFAALDPGLVIPYQQAFEVLPPNHGQI